MITYIDTTTDRTVVAACPLGASLLGTGLSSSLSGRVSALGTPALSLRERAGERPTQAPAEAVMAQAKAYAFAATNGAGNPKTQQHPKWAFRGLEPWSDPA
ncbi:hypothetical protein ACIP98_25250 [Streptomyces sp. NPDC088354]|uniref:hypothetical protein n=1 Tax=unclassified Streptomyces TaxID=2593676 RepID=UPI0029A1A1C6|nr:hypothetical protein [Streptomyces sp. MI02-7b]MDX3077723.1 hypothetical protein [Streptomyces sp. MI02-7b]